MQADARWLVDDAGMELAFGTLNATLRDYARFGRLYLNEGRWQGEQIVPADWVRASVTPDAPHLQPGERETSSYALGYGYQWWIYRQRTASGPKMYGGWGWGGQFPLIVPELDLIAVFTGWNIRDDVDYAYAFDLFYERIVKSVSAP